MQASRFVAAHCFVLAFVRVCVLFIVDVNALHGTVLHSTRTFIPISTLPAQTHAPTRGVSAKVSLARTCGACKDVAYDRHAREADVPTCGAMQQHGSRFRTRCTKESEAPSSARHSTNPTLVVRAAAHAEQQTSTCVKSPPRTWLLTWLGSLFVCVPTVASGATICTYTPRTHARALSAWVDGITCIMGAMFCTWFFRFVVNA